MLLLVHTRDDDDGSNSGSAYIFERNSDGNWSKKVKFTASDAAGGDWFGYSVAISGNYAIVGAYYDDDDGSSSGSAYIFERNSDGTWNENETKKLTATDAAGGDEFGRALAISGNYAIVGAYKDDDDGSSSGSAYIFELAQETTPLFVVVNDESAYNHGCVGIGTNDPKGQLSIRGTDIGSTSEANPGLWEMREGGLTFELESPDGNFETILGEIAGYHRAGNNNSSSGWPTGLLFKTSESSIANTRADLTTRMVINANGYVGIGTTNPQSSLHVVGHKANIPTYEGVHIGHDEDEDYGITICAANSNRYPYLDFTYPGQDFRGRILYSNPSTRFQIYTNYYSGIVYINSNGFYTSSDRRIKNIVPANDSSSLEKLRNIETYWYDYKDTERHTQNKVLGFMAQQVNEHLPEAITISKQFIPNEKTGF